MTRAQKRASTQMDMEKHMKTREQERINKQIEDIKSKIDQNNYQILLEKIQTKRLRNVSFLKKICAKNLARNGLNWKKNCTLKNLRFLGRKKLIL